MRTLYTILFVLTGFCLSAQNSNISPAAAPCFTDELWLQKKNEDPGAAQREEHMNAQIVNNTSVSRMLSTYTIPVVVHIIHNNGPENISNAQVFTAIQQLNDAFANSGVYQDPNGVNTDIQFCLAQQDENGNFTNGIDRVVSPLTNLTVETDDITLKNLSRWDPTRYLNIWIVNSITSLSAGPGVAGYAYLPTQHGMPEDGIVNEAAYFGTTADDSKVLFHEVGHYLGLYHTFEGGCTNNNCQNDGDRVCDTPPDQSTAAMSCGSPLNTCTSDVNDLSVNNPFRPVANGGLGDQPDQMENYMDYGFQSCQRLFSGGQSTRMVAALTGVRASLLQSIGCQPLCSSPIIIGFTMSASTITAGGTVSFTNTTTGATAYNWLVNSSQFSTSPNAVYLFSTPGTYYITLEASNNDFTCDETMTQVVHVECGAQASFTVSPAGPYPVGATINFTNTSTAATTYQWMVDGVNQSAAFNYNQTFNTPGSHYAYLVAGNGQCNDTSTSFFFQIGNCGMAGITENWPMPRMFLKFSGTSLPTVIPDNTIPQPPAFGTECTSSYSDADGNLLLYTDGLTVWDRNHQPMPNGTGLMGAASATQSCVIVPQPGSSTRYYVFTTDCYENQMANGLRYSIVDLSLNNGNGAVVVGSKNILVTTGVGEHVGATYHSNGTDIWIATSRTASPQVYAYLLTASGLAASPIISTTGVGTSGGLGSFRFSQDGHRLAHIVVNTTSTPHHVRVCDFNNITGQCTNAFDIPSTDYPYGLEFSPDNSKLYVARLQGGKLMQYDLAAGGPSAIIASGINVEPFTAQQQNASYAHLRLGTDGRIWVNRDQFHLDYIPDPNLAGAACGYVTDGVLVPGPQFASIGWCLPNFLTGMSMTGTPEISGPRELCSFSTGTIEVAFAMQGDSTSWSHYGPGTVANATDSTIELTTAGVGGADTFMMQYFGYCGAILDTFIVHTVGAAPVDLGPDTFICQYALLNCGPNRVYGEWHDSFGNGVIGYQQFWTVFQPATYWVMVRDSNGCETADTVTLIAPLFVPAVDLGPDVTLCEGNVTTLEPNQSYINYTWQDNTHDSVLTVYASGTYWLTASDGCNVTSDTIDVIMTSSIPLDLGNDTAVCPGGFPFTLAAPAGYFYVWQDGSAAMMYTVNGPGLFSVSVTDANGCTSEDTVDVSICTALEPAVEDEVRIYPNPAGDALWITMGNTSFTVTVLDPLGQVVQVTINAVNNSIWLNTAHLADGIYFVEVCSGNQVMRQPVVIRH
jgi:hypothetical protein